jgi:hypothetical protein
VASDYCAYKADVFSLGCVSLELLLAPDDFRLMWLSAYDKANVVSKSYAEANPEINAEFVLEVKTSLESIGLMFHEMCSIDDLSHQTLMDILSFHPGCRLSLGALLETPWIEAGDEAAAYHHISEVIKEKRLEQSEGAGGGGGILRAKPAAADSPRRPALLESPSLSPPPSPPGAGAGPGANANANAKRVRRDTPFVIKLGSDECSPFNSPSASPTPSLSPRPLSALSEGGRSAGPATGTGTGGGGGTGVSRVGASSLSQSQSQGQGQGGLSPRGGASRLSPRPEGTGAGAGRSGKQGMKHNRPPPELKPLQPGRKKPAAAPLPVAMGIVTVTLGDDRNLLFSPVASPQTSPQCSPRRCDDTGRLSLAHCAYFTMITLSLLATSVFPPLTLPFLTSLTCLPLICLPQCQRCASA